MAAIRETLQRIMSQVLDVAPEEVTPDTDFFEDLGADSMVALEAVVLIEQEFDIEVPDDRMAEMRTFTGLEAVVEELVRKRSEPAADVS